ncbi:MAG: VOC family protein [Chitinophagaceae bacterium]|nr:VOC family protein [Chitinophagaceae bacterium]
MNMSIYPCIWFNNNGKEAAAFYGSIFPNTTVTEDNGMVQMLSINGQKMMFLNGGPHFSPNPSISFLIANEDEKETERLFNALAVGGVALMPLDSYPFSKKYGWVRDKFGITWQLYTGQKGDTDQYFTPTLMFINKQNGRAKEAITLYTKLFPHSKTQGILEYPQGGEDTAGNVQHGQFSIDGYTLACMDSSLNHTFNFDEGISLVVNTKDQQETDYYWNNLIADGGQESRCAWLKDKFGISWQIVPIRLPELLNSSDKQQSKRAMDAMLKMNKIVIADLEK